MKALHLRRLIRDVKQLIFHRRIHDRDGGTGWVETLKYLREMEALLNDAPPVQRVCFRAVLDDG